MRRREFATFVAVTAMWPHVARTQLPQTPRVGFLRSTSEAPFENISQAFQEGLAQAGFVEGENVSIIYRYADNKLERLPILAADMVRYGVAVIVGNSLAAEAAKEITQTVPIVFVTSDDPVQRGLVASLNRPGGNLTGFTFFGGGQLAAKRIEALHELVPTAVVIGFLMDPNWPAASADLEQTRMAARTLNVQLVVAQATSESDLTVAFSAILQSGAGALIVSGAPSFSSRRRALIRLAVQHRLPAIPDLRDYVLEGGLMSYSASLAEAYRKAGMYAGQILKGFSPKDLPVQQPTKPELVINLKAAAALGLTVPQMLLARADEVIE